MITMYREGGSTTEIATKANISPRYVRLLFKKTMLKCVHVEVGNENIHSMKTISKPGLITWPIFLGLLLLTAL